MARTRLTYFFELGDTGWSESIHTTLAPGDSPALRDLVNTYTTVRLPLLFQNAFLTHVRISDDDQFRDVSFFPTGLPAPGTAVGAAAAGAWTGVLIRMIASPTLRRSLFLRGLPYNVMDNRTQRFTPAFQAAMNAYIAALPSHPFGISGKTANPSQPILTAVGNTGVISLAGILVGATIGSTVQLTGVPTSIIATRFYRVIGVGPGAQLTLAGWPPINLTNQGFLRLTTKSVIQISAASAGQITERKVGRPFGQLRGRSRR